MVGSVIVHQNNIIGEGYHRKYGEAHAEVNAINSVKDKSLLSESTIYVSLEPCAHFGKTPPCCDLIIKHHFKRVVIGCRDPFPEVNGKGMEKIQNAGIEIQSGILDKECRELNKRFFTFHEQKRPYITLKWAQSADGFIDRKRNTEEPGINRVSCPESKSLVHKWRSEEDSILVGKNTVIKDNPSLTVRAVAGINPVRVILDSQLELINSKLSVFSSETPSIILNTKKNESKNNLKWVRIDQLDPKTICEALYNENILSVFVEGGAKVLQSFIDSGFYDEIKILQSPELFGEGVHAPVVSKLPKEITSYFTDHIYIYKNE